MRDVLLDTHAFLWFVSADPRLGEKAESLIGDPRITKHISIASVWEIAVKTQLKKLTLGTDYDSFVREFITDRELELVPIELGHLSVVASLPLHHRDPFDRLIIAQSIALDLPVLTRDSSYADYEIEVVW